MKVKNILIIKLVIKDYCKIKNFMIDYNFS